MTTIPFSTWEQCDLRVGLIKKIEDHPKADKLYVLTIDLGELGERTIVAGLKKHYTKEELINKKGIFIVNLEPLMLRGIKSEGMTLAATAQDGTIVSLLQPEKIIPAGSKIH